MALSQYDQQYLTKEQQSQIAAATKRYDAAKAAGDTVGMAAANQAAEAVRQSAGYSGGVDGSAYIKTQTVTAPTLNTQTTAPKADTAELEAQLKETLETAKAQAGAQVDQSVAQNVTDLKTAQQATEESFQVQRDRIDLDEALSKDAQVLYTETRGDRGGIGAAQYDSISNTAAQNRLAVAQEQRKLASDTAAKIAQLRAQGEFEKADQALALTQDYLEQLMELSQWAAEYNLSSAKFDESMAQWRAEYEMKLQQMEMEDSQWQAEFDQEAQETTRKNLAEAGEALLALGIQPSDAQLTAMGMTAAQAQSYIAAGKVKAASQTSSKTTAASGTSSASSAVSGHGMGEYALYLDAMEYNGDARTYVKSHYKDYGLSVLPAESAYQRWLEGLEDPVGENAFQVFLRKLNISLSEDTLSAVNALTAKYWPSLTKAQREQTAQLYAKYGKTYQYGS